VHGLSEASTRFLPLPFELPPGRCAQASAWPRHAQSGRALVERPPPGAFLLGASLIRFRECKLRSRLENRSGLRLCGRSDDKSPETPSWPSLTLPEREPE
jgi:hypothetical protein